MDHPRTVSELGEFGVIDRIAARIDAPPQPETWTGDDAAVLAAPGNRLLYTIDVLVEGVDFDFDYCLGSDVGHKAVAVATSDVAAMGGRARAAIVALSLPAHSLVSVVDGIVDGVVEAGRSFGVDLVGGDVSRASEISIAVAVIGTAATPVLRSGARPGDALCVTGTLGGAAAGLIALRRGLVGPGPTEGHPLPPALTRALEHLAARQLRPRPRLDEGVFLGEAGATAMIDVSDGLVADLKHLLTASGVGCRVELENLPVDPAIDALAHAVTDASIEPLDLALSGGEDLELLFTIRPERLDAIERLPTPARRIGWISEGAAFVGDQSLEDLEDAGWDHLLGR